MKKYINTIIALLFILWTYEPGVIDTLEMSESLAGPWYAVAGPYLFTPDGTEYMVTVVPELPQAFFRVRRELP